MDSDLHVIQTACVELYQSTAVVLPMSMKTADAVSIIIVEYNKKTFESTCIAQLKIIDTFPVCFYIHIVSHID